MMAITCNLSFSSHVLKLDDVVVVLGEYYYNDKTKEIEKRKRKMERGKMTLSQGSTKITVERRKGTYPKENGIQNTYSLHAFAR
jgi:hypothetical protein